MMDPQTTSSGWKPLRFTQYRAAALWAADGVVRHPAVRADEGSAWVRSRMVRAMWSWARPRSGPIK